MIEVYWTPILADIPEHYVSELNYYEPIRLSKEIDPKQYFGPVVSKCVSVVEELKNTFVIKSPIQFNATYDNKNLQIRTNMVSIPLDFLGDYLDQPNEQGVYQVKYPSYLFFTEYDGLTMTQLPAYYHENNYTKNVLGLAGSFDISNWTRPVRPAFKFKKDCNVLDIAMGDALCYLRFNSDKKIKLIRFDGSNLIDSNNPTSSLLINCVGFKNHRRKEYVPKTLIECYEAFRKAKYRKRMMKYINEHRLD